MNRLFALFVLTIYLCKAIRIEAESGTLQGGVTVAKAIAGYSGSGYLTNFNNGASKAIINFNVPAGVYEVKLGYHAASDKNFDFHLGDESGSGLLKATGNTWGTMTVGKFFVSSSTRSITISQGWGWYEIDYVELNSSPVSQPTKVKKQLVDARATSETKSLLSFLIDNYGKKILSGNYDHKDIDYVKKVTGSTPAVGGFDLMDYSPSRTAHGANATGQVENDIAWAVKTNGIVTLSWHWNAPMHLINVKDKEWWRGFYTSATTFDVETALNDQNSAEYKAIIRDLDVIAYQLKKFQDKKTPILWRPLHEASGKWFWWGAKGPSAFVKLWKLMYDRYVNHHNLHHLIWVYTSAAGEDPAWYPGNNYVDIIGLDVYTNAGASMSGDWGAMQARFNGMKLVTLSETGTIIVPAKTKTLGVWWSWFEIWGGFVTNESKISQNDLKAAYADPIVLSAEKLPKWRSYPVN